MPAREYMFSHVEPARQFLLDCIRNGGTEFAHQDSIVRHEARSAERTKATAFPNAILTFTPDLTNTPKIIIHCVRHAQGPHNLPLSRPERALIKDPGLTDLGVLQCATLCGTFSRHDKITHIVSSPSRRTILTTKFSFRPVLNRGVPIILLNFLKERGDNKINNGSGVEALREEFKDLNLNFDRLEEGWENRSMDYDMQGWKPLAIEMRRELYLIGQKALKKGQVNADGNVEILVTSHGGTLRTLDGTRRDDNFNEWSNTEHRAYAFFSNERAEKHGILPWQGLREYLHDDFKTKDIKKLQRKDLEAWGWKESEIEAIDSFRDRSLLGFQRLRADRKRLMDEI